MPLIPLKIQPGVFRNGTEYQSAGRWTDANLVRWFEGVMRPVGGWRKKIATAVSGSARGLVTWSSNAGVKYLAIGTHSKLYVAEGGLNLSDITPTGYSVGRASAVAAVGYGSQAYGAYEYGVERPQLQTSGVLPATTWAMDTFGENLLACASTDGKIYQWAPGTVGLATALTNAPVNNRAMVVTAERFVFALGAAGVPRRVQWCDQENATSWTPLATNQAGDFDLQTAGSIMAGRRTRSGTLIWTDTDVHLGVYRGPPFVYSFERVGSGCGLISANAVAAAETFAAWMSLSGFWIFDGYSKPLPSEVSDFVYRDLNYAQMSKISAMHNSQYGEIWWFYPGEASTECNKYVIWNYRENHWSIGSISRTVGSDIGVFGQPIAIDPSGYIYDHEIGWLYDSAVPYAESGPVEIGNGDQVMVARQLIPDEKTQGDVSASFKLKFYPNAPETVFGPYAMAAPTDVRFTARSARIRVESVRNSDWRVGVMRLEATAGGLR